MGNLDCIGLRVADKNEFSRVIGALARTATDEFPSTPGGRHLRWTDARGASISFHCAADGRIDCLTPFFIPNGGPARWKVLTRGPAVDPGCAHCSGADCDVLDETETMVTRATVQWLDFLPYREWLGSERTYDLDVAAFARGGARFFPDSAAFNAAQSASESAPGKKRIAGLAPESFIPSGMFAPPGGPLSQRAAALVCGHVQTATILTNTATGGRFLHAVVRSFFGPIDVVAAVEDDVPAPAPGAIARVEAWLVGRPATPP
jgi:hypothetical protein